MGAVGVVLLVVAGLIVWPLAEERWGPFRTVDQVCLFCGEDQHVEMRRGKVVRRIVTANDVSRWVRSLHPSHSTHDWITVSTGGRHHWFDSEVIACGAGRQAAGPQYAFLAKQRLGNAAGQRYLAGFHAALTLPQAELLTYVEQMGSEVMAATMP